MIDLYLRADTEVEMIEALPFARGDEGWLSAGAGFALDVIGPVVITPAVFEGDEIATPAVLDNRFHVNLRCSPDIAEQVPMELRVTPEVPYRVWA